MISGKLAVGPDAPTKYVLLPCKSLEALAAAREKFESDPEVQQAEFTNVPPTDPAYVRQESSLLLAFTGLPKLEVPAQAGEKKPRLFELRTYEAHSRKANKKKVEMLNVGEIAIFRRTGLQPVLFAETLVGAKLPNLTYLLVFDDLAARDKNWATFVADHEWKKLRTTSGYTNAEILTNITNVFLKPRRTRRFERSADSLVRTANSRPKADRSHALWSFPSFAVRRPHTWDSVFTPASVAFDFGSTMTGSGTRALHLPHIELLNPLHMLWPIPDCLQVE